MSELIDRQALRKFLVRAGQLLKCQDDKRTAAHAIGKVIEYIDKMPTIAAPRWVRVEERLPKEKCYLLFVVHYDAYHDTGLNEYVPASTKVVYGRFEPMKHRYWTWEDEPGLQACISNEKDEEEYGCTTLITHWMPLPEPPKEEG